MVQRVCASLPNLKDDESRKRGTPAKQKQTVPELQLSTHPLHSFFIGIFLPASLSFAIHGTHHYPIVVSSPSRTSCNNPTPTHRSPVRYTRLHATLTMSFTPHFPTPPSLSRPSHTRTTSAFNSSPGQSSSHAQPPKPEVPITRSRTLYYLSVRDTSVSGSSSKKYKQRGGYSELEDGEEREGLIAAEEGRGGAERGKGLPPKW